MAKILGVVAGLIVLGLMGARALPGSAPSGTAVAPSLDVAHAALGVEAWLRPEATTPVVASLVPSLQPTASRPPESTAEPDVPTPTPDIQGARPINTGAPVSTTGALTDTRTLEAGRPGLTRLELPQAPSERASTVPAPVPTPSLPAGTVTPPASATPTPVNSSADAETKVVLNQATVQQLMTLPGIGAKRAEAILELRTRLGGFRRPTDLLRIKGIGARMLRKIQPHFVLDAAAPTAP